MGKDNHKDKHHEKEKTGDEKKLKAKDESSEKEKFRGKEKSHAKEKPESEEMGGMEFYSGEGLIVFCCSECNAEQSFAGLELTEEQECPICAGRMRAKEGKVEFSRK